MKDPDCRDTEDAKQVVDVKSTKEHVQWPRANKHTPNLHTTQQQQQPNLHTD